MVTTEPPPRVCISGSAARAHATSEYALTSRAIQKPSRGGAVNRPSRPSAAAKATERTGTAMRPPRASPVSANARATSSSARTSQAVTNGLSTSAASARTFSSIRSPWYVKASLAPPSASRRAIAHAIERLLATPRTSPVFPSKSIRGLYGLSATLGCLAPHPLPCPRGGAHDRSCRIGRVQADPPRLRRADDSEGPHRHADADERDPERAHTRDRLAQAAAARAGVRPDFLRRRVEAETRRAVGHLARLLAEDRERAGRRRGSAEADDPVGSR